MFSGLYFFLCKQDIGQRVSVCLYKQILGSESRQAVGVPTAIVSLCPARRILDGNPWWHEDFSFRVFGKGYILNIFSLCFACL